MSTVVSIAYVFSIFRATGFPYKLAAERRTSEVWPHLRPSLSVNTEFATESRNYFLEILIMPGT